MGVRYDGVPEMVRESLQAHAPQAVVDVRFTREVPAVPDSETVLTVVLLDPWCDAQALRALHAGTLPMPPSLCAAAVWQRVEAALAGWFTVPRSAVTQLGRAQDQLQGARGLRKQQVEFLQRLAAGSTINEIAREGEYAERTLRRWHAQLLTRFGATSREDLIAMLDDVAVAHGSEVDRVTTALSGCGNHSRA